MASLVTDTNLGPEFDIGNIQASQIRLKIGSGLAIAPDGTISVTPLNTTTVENSYVAAVETTGDGNEPNLPHTFTSVRADTGWTVGADSVTYAGSPDFVEIYLNEFFDPNQSNALQRITPVAQITRNGIVIATINNSYQRHQSDHNSSSNNGALIDPNPGSNPVYQVISQQGSNQNDVLPITDGDAQFRAVEKITVFAP